jgi:hypothetical protein
MIFYDSVQSAHEKFFTAVLFISYMLIFVSFFGLSKSAPEYLATLDYYIRVYICLFLIWRFNPFRTLDKFTELDRKITFSAGLFILTTTALNNYVVMINDKVRNIIQS